MLQMLFYDKASKMRKHLTLSGSRVCEADVASRYNVFPIHRRDMDTLPLDPGGFAFGDTKPIEWYVGSVKVSIKPEHIHHILDLSTRTLKGRPWTKVYLGWCCLVVPTATWESILKTLETLAWKHDHGYVQLCRRMAK